MSLIVYVEQGKNTPIGVNRLSISFIIKIRVYFVGNNVKVGGGNNSEAIATNTA